MGLTTRFHPISLPVIRGGAAYSGYKLGRIRQSELSEDRKRATYITNIEDYPADLHNPSLLDHLTTLKECFVADISVTKIWQTYANVIYVEIKVDLEPGPEVDLAWLLDHPDADDSYSTALEGA